MYLIIKHLSYITLYMEFVVQICFNVDLASRVYLYIIYSVYIMFTNCSPKYNNTFILSKKQILYRLSFTHQLLNAVSVCNDCMWNYTTVNVMYYVSYRMFKFISRNDKKPEPIQKRFVFSKMAGSIRHFLYKVCSQQYASLLQHYQ
jgi:hypothetical protein